MMMNRRSVLAAALVACHAGPALAQGANVPPEAMAAVKAFYDPNVKDEQRPLSRRLTGLYKAALDRSRKDESPVSGLDFGPEIDGQDADDDYRTTLVYTQKSGDASKAVVEVSLRQFKGAKPVRLTYSLVNENGWRVDDIAKIGQKNGWRWSSLLVLGAKGQ